MFPTSCLYMNFCFEPYCSSIEGCICTSSSALGQWTWHLSVPTHTSWWLLWPFNACALTGSPLCCLHCVPAGWWATVDQAIAWAVRHIYVCVEAWAEAFWSATCYPLLCQPSSSTAGNSGNQLPDLCHTCCKFLKSKNQLPIANHMWLECYYCMAVGF